MSWVCDDWEMSSKGVADYTLGPLTKIQCDELAGAAKAIRETISECVRPTPTRDLLSRSALRSAPARLRCMVSARRGRFPRQT